METPGSAGGADAAQALALLSELRAARDARVALRLQNARESAAAVRAQIARGELKLKSDIKKSSAFVKKLKVLTEGNAESVLKDARELNLTRYVSECVAALTEAPLKASDLPAAVRASSLLHQRYEDFAPALAASLVAAFEACFGAEEKAKAVKRRIVLRLLSELFLAGVIDDVNVIAHIVQRVARREQQGKARSKGNMSLSSSSAGGSFSSSSSSAQLEVPLLVSFAKAVGMEFLGVRSKRFKEMEKQIGETPEFQEFLRDEPALVPAPVQRECLSSFLEAYDVVCKFYLAQHSTLVKLEARNEKEEANRGEVTEQHEQELSSAKLLFDKLQTSVNSLADALDREVPPLPLEKKDDESGRGGLLLWEGGDGSGRAEMQMDGPFDDEDTRAFYEDLPDLLELVPAVVLGLNEAEVAELKKKRDAASNGNEDRNGAEPEGDEPDADAGVADVDDDDMDGDVDDIVNAADADATAAGDDAAATTGDASAKSEPGEEAKEGESSANTAATSSSATGTSGSALTSYHHQLDAFFSSLEDMVNRDRCDKAAVEFCYKNSKASRNRLVKTLYMVPRTHLELLAYYARLVAILQSVLKDDIGGELVGMLVGEFNGLMKRRNQFRLESKVKNIRFLAELVKFRICPPNVGFACLKKCFADFQGHNVYVATTFLENCGRFLYCSKHTHVRTEKFLNAMMKLKSAKHLDPQLETLVENAYYMCKPPERVERTVKQYDPLYMFVLKVLYKDLNGANVNKVIKTLRKLPWEDKTTCGMVLKAVLKVTNGKVMHMKWVCEVVKGLLRYHDDLAILLVDDVLEAIRRGLEVNDYRDHQRSLGLIKLLGELFNCGLVTTNVVMETLYLLINHSHDLSTAPQYTSGQIPEAQVAEMKKQWQLVPDLRYDPRVVSGVDGPTEVFRIRLVCALIESCTSSGSSVAMDAKVSASSAGDRALSKMRLSRFMVFFQRYILSKTEIPLETDFVIFDLFDALTRSLKDSFKKLETWEDADLAAQIILAKELEETERRLAKKNALALEAAGVTANGVGEASSPGAESLSQPVDEEEEDMEEDDDSEGEDEDDDDDSDDDDEEEEEETAQVEGDDGDDDDDDDSDEDDSDEDDEEEEEEEEEEEQLIIHDRVQKSEEDEAFEKAFKSMMMQGSADTRKLTARVNVDKMAIPTVVKIATAPPPTAAMPFGGGGGAQSGVVFRMLRRGNKGKVEARHLVVPEESSLAQHSHRQESEGKKEQSELKRLVLQNMERDDFLGAEPVTPPVFPPPRPTASYASQAAAASDSSRAGFGGGSEWNNAEFGLRRGRGYRGAK